MPTSAHWEVANSPKISVKPGTFCRADVGIGPYDQIHGASEFAENFYRTAASRRADRVVRPYAQI